MLFQSERLSAAGANLRKVDYLLHFIWNTNITSYWCVCLKAINTRGLWYGFLEGKLLPTASDLVVNFSPPRTGTFSIPSQVVNKLLYRLFGVWRLLITFPLAAATSGVAILMFCRDYHQHFRSLSANRSIIQPKFGKGLHDINESGVFSRKCVSGLLCSWGRTWGTFVTWKGTFLSCSEVPFCSISLKDLERHCHLLHCGSGAVLACNFSLTLGHHLFCAKAAVMTAKWPCNDAVVSIIWSWS